jgi:hypothetical protein
MMDMDPDAQALARAVLPVVQPLLEEAGRRVVAGVGSTVGQAAAEGVRRVWRQLFGRSEAGGPDVDEAVLVGQLTKLLEDDKALRRYVTNHFTFSAERITMRDINVGDSNR